MMSMPKTIQHYLARHALEDGRSFFVGSREGIDQVVVIPALAEKDTLLETLCRLSANPPSDLGRTLVICVVNNRDEGLAAPEDIENNQLTLKLLQYLIDRNIDASDETDERIRRQCREVILSGLRPACIDASSRGMEMPEKGGGVGLARKLGLDMALRLFDYRSPARKLLLNLDADAWVEPHYLAAVRKSFEDQKVHAAVIRYAHRPEADHGLQSAICCYEIFLGYYVMGLRFAGSPYAFHAIGSTMVCTAESYAAVLGMNRREAGEDFYFLDKLAKLSRMAHIQTTTVYPSARPSRRVPFGTGRRVIRFLEGRQDEYLLYDPEVFRILGRWLALMPGVVRHDAQTIQEMAAGIHPRLGSFLELNQFQDVWRRIQKNHSGHEALKKQFHVWFDGFKTMKLIHYLTDSAFPRIDMFAALKTLFRMMDVPCAMVMNSRTSSNVEEQRKIIDIIGKYNNPNMFLT